MKPFMLFERHDHRALWAVWCVGVHTLARIGELLPGESADLQVLRESLTMRVDEGSLRLVGTKTDNEHKGVTLKFCRTGGPCCPFLAMSAYLPTSKTPFLCGPM